MIEKLILVLVSIGALTLMCLVLLQVFLRGLGALMRGKSPQPITRLFKAVTREPYFREGLGWYDPGITYEEASNPGVTHPHELDLTESAGESSLDRKAWERERDANLHRRYPHRPHL